MVEQNIERYHPDVVVVAGDITHFGPVSWARDFLDHIPIKTFAVHGNCDPFEVIDEIDRSRAELLHRRRVEYEGYTFVGLGGSNPTPFLTLVEEAEHEIAELSDVMEHEVILVSHAPSLGHVDLTHAGSHAGSTALADLVRDFSPIIHVSGHIHEARGIEMTDSTLFVNPGKAAQGYAALIDVKKREARLI